MKIVLATGIYPPDIGGPATYVQSFADELLQEGNEVSVITYRVGGKNEVISDNWKVVRVPKSGGPLVRWWRYAAALRKHASDADIVYAFSSVSAGVPLRFASLQKPKKILRLGGDFLWERYTDRCGNLGLREWYDAGQASRFAPWLLKLFDHVVFSTDFQRDLYRNHYPELQGHSVIENAQPHSDPVEHKLHKPLRLLSFGRLVHFKNLDALIEAMKELHEAILTIVGEGPEKHHLQSLVDHFDLDGRVIFVDAVPATERPAMFRQQDLLVVPSITDISPNAALEARAAGLPVLLTKETGLSSGLTDGMVLRELKTAEQIVAAITDITKNYDAHAKEAARVQPTRGWEQVAAEHLALFEKLNSRIKYQAPNSK